MALSFTSILLLLQHVELYIPGTVYWLRPDMDAEESAKRYARRLNNTSSANRSRGTHDSGETDSDGSTQLPDIIESSITSYRLHTSADIYTGTILSEVCNVIEGVRLTVIYPTFTGFLLTGANMIQDHSLESYTNIFVHLKKQR